MSKFSKCLSQIKEKRGFTVAQIASIVGQEKNVILRWINGREIPSDWNMIGDMLEKLQLSVKEEKMLHKAYRESVVGETEYLCNNKIIEIIKLIHQRGVEYQDIQYTENLGECKSELPGFVRLNNKMEILQWVQRVLEYLLLQPEKNLKLNFHNQSIEIQVLLKLFLSQMENCRIEEIVYLVKEGDYSAIHNLEVFKKVTELLIRKNPVEIFSVMEEKCEEGFSFNYILSDNFVLQFDEKMTLGMMVTEPEWLEFFKNSFEKIKKFGDSFGGKECSWTELLGNYGAVSEQRVVTLEYMPCITVCLTREILEDQILPGIPEREKMIDQIVDFINWAQQGDVSETVYHCFFTREGMHEFMETGRFETFPYGVYKGFELETRCELLERGVKFAQMGRGRYQMIREDGKFLDMKGVFIEEGTGAEDHLIIDMHFTPTAKERFNIKNKEICRQFSHFFSFLGASEYVYSKEETVAYMKQTVVEYRRRINKET